MAHVVDARVDRTEFMVEDSKGNILNADMISRYQTLASGKDDRERTDMLVEQSITTEDGQSLALQKDGTFKAIETGEIFHLVPDPDEAV
ncbi:MAG: hypothetical protein U1E62_22150 [Alsobacter sp.]